MIENNGSAIKRWISGLPVARKILGITLISSVSALLILCVFSFIYAREANYERILNVLDNIKYVIESNTHTAFQTNDSRAASEYLESLSEAPGIESICLYDKEGNVFAFNSRDDSLQPHPRPDFTGSQTDGNRLYFSSEILKDEEALGTMLIEVNTRPLNAAIGRLLWVNVALFGVGLSIAAFLATKLQKSITVPIKDLVGVTRKIANETGYEAKAVKRHDDEIGLLVDSVNDMLETIRVRDESLRNINSSLEQVVEKRTKDLNERNKALNRAIDAAKKAALAKNEFLATTSHELRTPLNPIIGYVDRLLNKTNDMEDARELEIIKQSAELLLRLIDDILDFSRVERGEIRLQNDLVNLQKCCSDVIFLMMKEADTKGLKLEFEFDLPPDYNSEKAVLFESDEGRLRQVVLNLIGNAIKFTESGTVSVTAIISKKNDTDGQLHVSIEDTGIGISDSDLEELFKPFTQVDGGMNRSYGGMGLGLAICRGFIEALGGKIDCESERGVGSRFWFEIPIVLKGQSNEDAVDFNRFELPEKPDASLSILLVDDERVNRELGASMIRSLGYTVICAKDGFEALKLCGKQAFDLILLDIRMPRLDGFETAQAIREREDRSPPTPIVALSAPIALDDEQRCAEVGMNGYLQKPLKMDTLNATLVNLLSAADEGKTD